MSPRLIVPCGVLPPVFRLVSPLVLITLVAVLFCIALVVLCEFIVGWGRSFPSV